MRNKTSAETFSGISTTLKATHEFDINLELIPKRPPYTVHLSNVSFEADEAKIKAFFKDLKVLTVRLPVDERNRIRGYGHVEFGDRESLIAALTKKDTDFNNRPIKISLDEPKAGGYGGSQGDGAGYMQRGQQEGDYSSHRDDRQYRREGGQRQQGRGHFPQRDE